MIRHFIFPLFIVLFAAAITARAQIVPPGTVINHWYAEDGKYIGSPSICILPNGHYIATHDEFGPNSAEYSAGRTHVYRSCDKGKTWQQIGRIDGQHWSTVFNLKNTLYIIGMSKVHGDLVIRRSTDEGMSWTTPFDNAHGLIAQGEFHTAPVPVLIHNGRIYRALENAKADNESWPRRYSAVMISAPLKSDLLNARNWTISNSVSSEPYLDEHFKGWLEGNAVALPSGEIADILRAHTIGHEENCAILHLNKDGNQLTFNTSDFHPMPGGAKKFSIRYDRKSRLYWTLSNAVPDSYNWGKTNCDLIRNYLYLMSSPDLLRWTLRRELIAYPADEQKHGFQYPDWQFEGSDIVFVSRTAFDDDRGGAHTQHDANYLTFHRISNFRK